MARQIGEMDGGTIWVESAHGEVLAGEGGKGSTFKFVIPDKTMEI